MKNKFSVMVLILLMALVVIVRACQVTSAGAQYDGPSSITNDLPPIDECDKIQFANTDYRYYLGYEFSGEWTGASYGRFITVMPVMTQMVSREGDMIQYTRIESGNVERWQRTAIRHYRNQQELSITLDEIGMHFYSGDLVVTYRNIAEINDAVNTTLHTWVEGYDFSWMTVEPGEKYVGRIMVPHEMFRDMATDPARAIELVSLTENDVIVHDLVRVYDHIWIGNIDRYTADPGLYFYQCPIPDECDIIKFQRRAVEINAAGDQVVLVDTGEQYMVGTELLGEWTAQDDADFLVDDDLFLKFAVNSAYKLNYISGDTGKVRRFERRGLYVVNAPAWELS